MAKLPEGGFDPFEFLVERKFGAGTRYAGTTFPRSRTNPEFAKRVAEYRAELRGLPRRELDALVDSERKKQQAELVARIEREERERFFNQPSARADFVHWSRAAHWTLDEAIALSFGKAPERVNWKTVEPYAQVSAFAFQYQRRRDLALRATVWQQLFDPVLPGFFLAWAKRTGLDVSPDLEAAVAARGTLVADWKTQYDELKATFDEHHRKWVEVCEGKNRVIAELQQQLQEPKQIQQGSPERSVGSRERDSLLKLIIGMAVGGYGYDPSASRSEQPSQIASDLATAGVALDVDTVRKWLKQAAELLPRQQAE
jgi:hypothetical protein